jgi:hypothetical protein
MTNECEACDGFIVQLRLSEHLLELYAEPHNTQSIKSSILQSIKTQTYNS